MKQYLAHACYSSGLLGLAPRFIPFGRFLVLMYHRLGRRPDPFLAPLTVDDFEKQLKYLIGHFRVATLKNIVAGTRVPSGRARARLAITFDDCFEDFYHAAYPILKRLKVPATVFISTGFVNSDRVPWTDELGFLFRETPASGIRMNWGRGEKAYRWNDTADRLEAFREIKSAIKNLRENERREVFEEVRERLRVEKKNPSRIMNSGQIREMAAAGIEFGAHTVNHVILTRVPPETAKREIDDSKKQMESITGLECAGFCYPNGEPGDFNPEIKDFVRKAGYTYACTVIDGSNGAGTDRFELRRIWTSERRLPFFAARLARTAIKKQK